MGSGALNGKTRLNRGLSGIDDFEHPVAGAQMLGGGVLHRMRSGKSIGWWERGAAKLKAGDKIIEVIPDHLFPRVPTV